VPTDLSPKHVHCSLPKDSEFLTLGKGDLQVTSHCCVSPRLPLKNHLNSHLGLIFQSLFAKTIQRLLTPILTSFFFWQRGINTVITALLQESEFWPHLPWYPADLLESYRVHIKPFVLTYTGLFDPMHHRSHWLRKRHTVKFVLMDLFPVWSPGVRCKAMQHC